jgi:sialate O-acetylesterase
MGDFDKALNTVDSISAHIKTILLEDSISKLTASKPKQLLNTWPGRPSVFYNAMIAPVIPYSIRGVIWYQGESNVGRAVQYTKLFPLMIGDWRKRWNQGIFPFYFVQIAPFTYGGNHTQGAAMREAQRRTLASSPNTGMAVTLDIGSPNNIHPANKQDVGKRLALWALNKTYHHKDVVYSGPLYKAVAKKGNKMIVSFTNTDGGLSAHNKPLIGFELKDVNGLWKPATATIDGDKVCVVNDSIQNPVAVRYAFYDSSVASLFNNHGLPASSFTSED